LIDETFNSHYHCTAVHRPSGIGKGGGGAERVLLLGSMTQNASFQGNISGETNETNQSNISIQDRGMIDIKSSMSPVSVFNSSQVTKMPDSILANSIAYQFTA